MAGKKAAKKDRPAEVPGKESGTLELRGSAVIRAAEGEGEGAKKDRRFEIIGYTGEPLQQGFLGWDYPVIVDLAGVDVGDGVMPALDNHGPGPCSDESARDYVVGQTDSVEVEAGELVFRGKMLPDDESRGGVAAKDIIAKADNGYRWQGSIGARTTQKDFIAEGNTALVNGRTHEGPCYVARKTVVREISFVVNGADRHTSAVIATGARGTIMAGKKGTFGEYCKAEYDTDEDKMSEKMKARVKAEYDAEDEDEDDDKDDDKKDKDTKARADLNVRGNGNRRPDLTVRTAEDALSIEAVKKQYRDEIVAENRRVREITDLTASNPNLEGEVTVKGKKQTVNVRDFAIQAGYSAEQIQPIWALAELRASRQDAPVVPGGLGYSTSAPIMNGEVLEAAILQAGNCRLGEDSFYFDRGRDGPERRVPEDVQRATQSEMKARYTDQVMQAAHTHFGRGGIGLHQVLTIAARANGGYRGPETINQGNLETVLRAAFAGNIRAEGSSAISMQNTLANVLNKFLLAGYLFTDQSWREIAATRPVKDFKPTKSINVFGDFVFKKLGADGQIQNAAMTDEAFANQIDTFARKLGIGRQTIINDDLSALTTVPLLMGIGSSDAVSILFWTLWLAPPVWASNAGGDGNAFWYATRSVTASALGGGAANPNALAAGAGTALSSSSLQSAVQLFDKQVKPNGQPLGVNPEILLYPPEVDVAAVELMNAQFLVYGGGSASKQPNTNVWKGRFKPVKSPYLSNSTYTGNSTTAWWLLAAPTRVAAIEMAFLNGQETPTVQTAQANFNELGIDVRGFFDFGAAMQNIRAGVKSPGA